MPADLDTISTAAHEAAEMLKRVAADEGAKLVEKADAAAAAFAKTADMVEAEQQTMAPSVIVVSMFETLQRQAEVTGTLLRQGQSWMAATDLRLERFNDGLANLDRKVNEGLASLDKKVSIQNGGVKKSLEWIQKHDARLEAEANIVQGRREQREDDLELVHNVQSFFSDFWPLLLGIALSAASISSLMWDWRPW